MVKQKAFTPYKVENIDEELNHFRDQLVVSGLGKNTIDTYIYGLKKFFIYSECEVSPEKILIYKSHLIETSAPQTVNSRLNCINRYLMEKEIHYGVRFIKLEHEQYNDNIISMHDYLYLKQHLKEDGNYYDYFLVWAFASTGARVSEMIKLKVENIYDGIFHIYGKGLKPRTIFLPVKFCEECKEYLESIKKDSGFVFSQMRDTETPITRSYAEMRIRRLSYKYKIDSNVMHPHSFRHLFAKTFNERNPNLVLLKDIMGHTNIATTALYCKPTLNEMIEQYNAIVDW